MTDNTPSTEHIRENYSTPWHETDEFNPEQAAAEFDRWLAAYTEQVRAEVLAEQDTEWEYSIAYPRDGEWDTDGVEPFDSHQDALDDLEKGGYLSSDRVVRRRKAGPWAPVPITESEEAS